MQRFERIALVAAACCVGAMTPMAAQAKAIKSTSGLILADGSILAGSGYLVIHNGTGDYSIVFGKGAFKATPVATCTGAGIASLLPICNIASISYFGDGSATIEVRLYARSSGAIEDNGFTFTEVTSN